MNKVGLIILDGWGHGKKDTSNAILAANTPFVDELYSRAKQAELLTDGENVGLPAGQMGNSEVGHMNIGAGRVVYQDLVRINQSIEKGEFFNHPVLKETMHRARSRGRLHLMGLVSEGGVHSSQDHLHALCTMAQKEGIKDVFVHAFTDGRDTDPRSAKEYLKNLENHLETTGGELASVIGRYFAMDRDKRWERVRKAYDLLVHRKGASFTDASSALAASYESGVTDEFIEPVCIETASSAAITEGDVVICFNFRTDRCREITQALTQQAFPEHEMSPLSVHYVTMTNYDTTFRDVKVVFEKDNLNMTLGEVLSDAGASQVRIAETEKYPHVTFFFSGGREVPFDGEDRIMVNSPKVATYDLQPEMSAFEVVEAITTRMDENAPDFICLNFANPDMVGHTGVFEAIVKACEATDTCLRKVVEKGLSRGYRFVIIADHGNADCAVNPDGSPNTAHTTNPVPVFILDPSAESVENGILADVAPTILSMMGIDQPKEMTGSSLIS